MTITLYELLGAEDRRFSPYCWRIRMALALKGLEAERVPVGFDEKDKIAFSGQKLVPVLVDGDTCVHDSWDIACYMDRAYPDRPALFGDGAAMGLCRFVNRWADRVVNGGIFPLIIHDICSRLTPADQVYFRETREKRMGKTIEAVQEGREDRVEGFRAALSPLRATLGEQAFLSGDSVGYADCIVFGGFQWARIMSDFALIEADDPIHAWRKRMIDRFDTRA